MYLYLIPFIQYISIFKTSYKNYYIGLISKTKPKRSKQQIISLYDWGFLVLVRQFTDVDQFYHISIITTHVYQFHLCCLKSNHKNIEQQFCHKKSSVGCLVLPCVCERRFFEIEKTIAQKYVENYFLTPFDLSITNREYTGYIILHLSSWRTSTNQAKYPTTKNISNCVGFFCSIFVL